MTDYILLKQGELVLKGLNKHRFEQQLLKNIRYRLKPIGQCKVYARQSIVYVEPMDDETDMDEVFEALQTVFGISITQIYRSGSTSFTSLSKTVFIDIADNDFAAGHFKKHSRKLSDHALTDDNSCFTWFRTG